MKRLFLDRFWPRLPHGPVSQVILQASPFCNIDCDYCYLHDRSSKARLPLDFLEAIFHRLLSSSFLHDTLTVVWHAGEPLAVPLSYYEAAFAKISQLQRDHLAGRVHIDHAMQTNATLINDAWCDFIRAHQIRIGVSLDGPAFIHDAHRKTRSGKGTHHLVMRGVEMLLQRHIDFQVIMVVTQEALDFPDEVYRFFVDQGIRRVAFNVEEVEGDHRASSLQHDGTEARYRAFMERFYRLTQASDGALQVREFDEARQVILQHGVAKSSQNHPFAMLNVAHDGRFSTFSPELVSVLHPDYGDFMLGNIYQDTLESASMTPKFRRIYRDIKAGVRACQRTCEYFSLCGGGAPANKFFENQSLRSSETMYCRLRYQTVLDIVLHDMESQLANITRDDCHVRTGHKKR